MTRVRDITDRFRREAFFDALDAKRQREGVSWRDVAREVGVTPSTFTRLSHGADPDMRTFALLVAWLRADIRPFFVGAHGSASPRASDVRAQTDVAIEAVQRLAALAGFR